VLVVLALSLVVAIGVCVMSGVGLPVVHADGEESSAEESFAFVNGDLGDDTADNGGEVHGREVEAAEVEQPLVPDPPLPEDQLVVENRPDASDPPPGEPFRPEESDLPDEPGRPRFDLVDPDRPPLESGRPSEPDLPGFQSSQPDKPRLPPFRSGEDRPESGLPGLSRPDEPARQPVEEVQSAPPPLMTPQMLHLQRLLPQDGLLTPDKKDMGREDVDPRQFESREKFQRDRPVEVQPGLFLGPVPGMPPPPAGWMDGLKAWNAQAGWIDRLKAWNAQFDQDVESLNKTSDNEEYYARLDNILGSDESAADVSAYGRALLRTTYSTVLTLASPPPEGVSGLWGLSRLVNQLILRTKYGKQ
jgi:hypothetical protein